MNNVIKLLDLFYSLSESEKSEFLSRITAPAAFAGGGNINFGSRKSNICDDFGESLVAFLALPKSKKPKYAVLCFVMGL